MKNIPKLLRDQVSNTQGKVTFLKAFIERVADEFENLEKERDQLKEKLGNLRMCVNCGKTIDSSLPRDTTPEDCTSPGACTFNLTPQEAWLYWRRKYYELQQEKYP